MFTYRLLATWPYEFDDGDEYHVIEYDRRETELEAESDEQAVSSVEQEAREEVWVLGKRNKFQPTRLTRVVKEW